MQTTRVASHHVRMVGDGVVRCRMHVSSKLNDFIWQTITNRFMLPTNECPSWQLCPHELPIVGSSITGLVTHGLRLIPEQVRPSERIKREAIRTKRLYVRPYRETGHGLLLHTLNGAYHTQQVSARNAREVKQGKQGESLLLRRVRQTSDATATREGKLTRLVGFSPAIWLANLHIHLRSPIFASFSLSLQLRLNIDLWLVVGRESNENVLRPRLSPGINHL